jgi:RNA polymerase sigma-70 factor (ECF subfamily)
MKRTLDHWFATQILPSEAGLMRYLRRVAPRAADVADLRQEVYMRVYEGAAKSLPQHPQRFLFVTARNLLIDRLRRERVVSIDYTQDIESLHVNIDELSPERRLGARQELQRLSEVFDQLPEKTRAAIWLRRVEGLSQREAADLLGLNVGALESHMSRGLRAITNATLGGGPDADVGRGASQLAEGTEHGQRND